MLIVLLLQSGVVLFAGSTVTEICVGTGPCGELRYPAYQEKGGKWSYFGEALRACCSLSTDASELQVCWNFLPTCAGLQARLLGQAKECRCSAAFPALGSSSAMIST